MEKAMQGSEDKFRGGEEGILHTLHSQFTPTLYTPKKT